MLAETDEQAVRDLLKRTGMPRRTEHTLTTPDEFVADLARTRARGYALDDGEQELGVRCVAVAGPDAPRPMALSMSGPLTRMSDQTVLAAAPVRTAAAEQSAAELRGPAPFGDEASA